MKKNAQWSLFTAYGKAGGKTALKGLRDLGSVPRPDSGASSTQILEHEAEKHISR
jgi:hypothetical protein